MGEIALHPPLSLNLFDEISDAFDQVLAECDHFLTKSYFAAVDGARVKDAPNHSATAAATTAKSSSKADAVDTGPSEAISTTACTMCGRKFLPERLVSIYRVNCFTVCADCLFY